jgi:hypothetical protein
MLAFAMHRRRGNPNWGWAFRHIPEAATEFDMQVRKLGLTRETCLGSSELRHWCWLNKERCYIPEWPLGEWGIAQLLSLCAVATPSGSQWRSMRELP